jgi:hypothetical protein
MAAGSTYTPLATQTLASATATVTFSSISGSYTDLVLVCSGKSNTATLDYTRIRVNSDTGANYSRTYLGGNGSSAYSGRDTSATSYIDGIAPTTASGIYAPTIFNLQNYSNTTTYKTILSKGGSANDSTGAIVGLWRNTAAITSIDISNINSNSFAPGSTFTLYGIAAA